MTFLYVAAFGWLAFCGLGTFLAVVIMYSTAKFITEMNDYDPTFWFDKWIDNRFKS